MRLLLGLFMMAALVMPMTNLSWAEYDYSHLREPEITVEPTAGPPGTQVTIKVSNLPDISDEPYPYPYLYIYLPFSASIGANIKGNCDGEPCFPIYTYEDAKRKNFADKEILFTLFSVHNPKPVYQSGQLYSVCDIKVNEKIQQSFPETCYKVDQPQGKYQIKFAWAANKPKPEFDIFKVVNFTVTAPDKEPLPPEETSDEIIIREYKEGKISEAEFEAKLKDLGFNLEDIRKIKGMIGKLPHQTENDIPRLVPLWIKDNARWWSQSRISDTEFSSGLEFMIKEGIIKIPNTSEIKTEQIQQIPSWVKFNAGWWAEDKISEDEFIKSIQYLVKSGIIRV